MLRQSGRHSVLIRSFGIIRPSFGAARRYAVFRSKPEAESEYANLSTDEKAEYLRKLTSAIGNNPTIDHWGTQMGLFDLHIPAPVMKSGMSISLRMTNLFENQLNLLKSILSMYKIAKENSFPGVSVRRVWSWNLFKVMSTSDNTWVAPLRNIAYDTYKQLNKAMAENDRRVINKITSSAYRINVQQLLKTRNPDQRYVWGFHSEIRPPKIISLRATEGNFQRGILKYGNRLVIQVLIRFDTMQTLSVFSKKGMLMSPDTGVPRRVTEYLVFEKKMWYDTPWTIKQQLY